MEFQIMKFLIVDDSAVDRHLLSSLLEDQGHQVEVCDSTSGALDKIASGSYDSVFLDIVMPEQDGYRFLRAVRSSSTTAKQHVIFCSSKTTALEIDYGIKRAGANAYLSKPVTRATLAETLEKVSA
jgi:CheY-like chemotaxis protein